MLFLLYAGNIHSIIGVTIGPQPLPKRIILVLPISDSSMLSFREGHPLAAYVCFFIPLLL